MDIKALLASYTSEKEFTVEGQIRWLQKQGFTQDQIDQAILTVYFDLERGVLPNKWSRTASNTSAGPITELVYFAGDQPKPNVDWEGGPISGGNDLDQYLLKVAKDLRTKELSDKAQQLGVLVAKMKSQWEIDAAKANAKPGFFKRMFSKAEA
jgi:hypothetical protein